MQDPIEFELISNALHSIADKMALTVFRTSYSGSIRDNMDYSTGLFDAHGRLIAQGLTLPGHLGSMPSALAAVLAKFGGTLAPGDVFVLNDPFEGGMHLPDIFLFKPVFAAGRLIAIAATVCHHADVGGRVPGSNSTDSTEIFQEGLRLPPCRLYRGGEPVEAVFDIIEKNVRLPRDLLGDLRAQLAACHVCEVDLLEVIQQWSVERLLLHFDELLDYTEKVTRAELASLPDGRFEFEDFIDDDGIETGKPIRLHVVITKEGDGISADWSGSSRQVKGAINCTLSLTRAVTYCAVRCILRPDIPNNEGVFRTVEVIAEPGTIANAVPPAACAARALTAFRMVDTVFGALSRMCPDRVFAASDGGNTAVAIGGYYATRDPFIYIDFTCSAWGGRPRADGLDGVANIFANMAAQSVEMVEQEQPIQILAYTFVADAMGAGKFRGGAPTRKEYRFLEDEALLQVRSDRRVFSPYGLHGGRPGKPSASTLLRPGEEPVALPAKVTMTIRKGAILRHDLAGGGGWGNPLERDPARVLADVRAELLSEEAAFEDYGVVVRRGPWAVDEDATRRRRAELAARQCQMETASR